MELGLSSEEADARLREHGPNRVRQVKRPPYARIAVRQLQDPLVALLAAAAGVSLVVGEGLEAAVIAAIVLLNGILGFVQEVGAERAVLALGDRVARTATVVRGGDEAEIPAAEVVPGDLLLVYAGDRIAADARLVEVSGFEVDESMLTGESVPVAKHTEPIAVDAPPAERESMVFAGTGATRGHAAALVTVTGSKSEVGRLTELMQGIRRLPTPLQLRLRALARTMAAIGGVITVLLGGVLWAQGAAARRSLSRRRRRGDCSGSRRIGGNGHDRPRARSPGHGRARRDRAQDVCGRDRRAGDGHLRRQDRHSDRESASGGSDLAGARLDGS